VSSPSVGHDHEVIERGRDGTCGPIETWGPFDRCFSVEQAARILGTSPATVRRLLQKDLIAHQKVSAKRTVIRESALRAYLESVTRGPCP
jgi:excisionase family DNA binding protein